MIRTANVVVEVEVIIQQDADGVIDLQSVKEEISRCVKLQRWWDVRNLRIVHETIIPA